MDQTQTCLNFEKNINIINPSKNVFYIINKSQEIEYISSDSFINKDVCMKEELTNITEKDEQAIIKYLLELMKKYDIITEEEYQTVKYKL